MNSVRVKGSSILTKYDKKELTLRMSKASGVIKTNCGIANNAAWAATLEAHDHVKNHPRYRFNVKRAFREAIDLFRRRELQIVHDEKNRLFHLADLLPESRRRYGDITDSDYYEYWCSSGQTAYYQKRAWATAVRNKFRLTLERHGVPYADDASWAMMADACLRMAQARYANVTNFCVEEWQVPRALVDDIFGLLNMEAVADKWDAALTLLVPETANYKLEESEQRNIQLSLDQLMEQWTSVVTITDSLHETIQERDDIFRSKKEQRKALIEVVQLAASEEN